MFTSLAKAKETEQSLIGYIIDYATSEAESTEASALSALIERLGDDSEEAVKLWGDLPVDTRRGILMYTAIGHTRTAIVKHERTLSG